MKLKISDVKIGQHRPPAKWDNGKQEWVNLDPREYFLKRLSGKGLVFQNDTFDNLATVFHRNMLEYLQICWQDHLGVTLTPDMIWYTLLCELSSIVRKNPEQYRNLFTESSEKQEILVLTGDPVTMPIDRLVAALGRKVPTDTEKFIVDYSTTNDRSIHAQSVAFCDICSPYYNYGMLLCGIPFVDVRGSVDDYRLMKQKWDELSSLFSNMPEWTSGVSKTIQSIIDNHDNADFWAKMFRLEKCGSGHQEEVEGWIANLFRDAPEPRYIQNYTTGVSCIDYKNIGTNKDYKMQEGLFFSTEEDGFLVPDFAFTVHEKAKELTGDEIKQEPGWFSEYLVSIRNAVKITEKGEI